MRRERVGRLFCVLAASIVIVGACAPAAAPSPLPPPLPTPSAATPSVALTPITAPTPGEAQPRYGGVLLLVQDGDPEGFDPHQETGRNRVLGGAVGPVTNGILQFDPIDQSKIVGDLAERWEVSPDGKVYTFHFPKGIKFHDGTPFTADDAKFSIDRIRRPPKGMVSPRKIAFDEVIDSVQVVNRDTLSISLKYPSASFVEVLAVGWNAILPRHIVEPLGGKKISHRELIGTGPFVLKEFLSAISIEWTKNKDYFVKGRPYVDGMKMFMMSDGAAQHAAFKTGRIQVTYLAGTGMLPSDVVAIKRMRPEAVVQKALTLNHPSLGMNTKRKPFDDPRVRKAIFLAVDRQMAVQILQQGDGLIGGPFPPTSSWAIPQEELLKMPGYRQAKDQDIAEAKRLLSEAGYPDGFKTTLLARPGKLNEDMAVFSVDQLSKIGIKAQIQGKEVAAFVAAMNGRNFDLFEWAQGIDLDEPNVIFGQFYVSNGERNYEQPDGLAAAQFSQIQIEAKLPEQRRVAMRFVLAASTTFVTIGLLILACAPAAAPTPAPMPTPILQVPLPTPTPRTAATPTPTPQVVVPATPTAKPAVKKEEDPTYGGILVLGAEREMTHFDLHQRTSVADIHPFGPLFNNLIQYDPLDQNKIIPDLAERWEVSADGQPFSAEDVKYSLERIYSPPEEVISHRQETLQSIKKVEASDANTVKVTLSYPSASFIALVANPWNVMVPKHVLEKEGQDALKKKAVGTGPFKFKDYTKAVSFEAAKQLDYFVPGRPYLDGYKFFVIPHAQTRLAALRSGRVHILRSSGVSRPDKEVLEREMGAEVVVQSSPHMSMSSGTPNTTRPPLNDVRVRQALSLGVDRKAYIQVAHRGDMTIGGPMFTRGKWALPAEEMAKMPGFGPDIEANRAQARKLLAEAGYPDGFSITFIVKSESPADVPGTEFLLTELRKIGLKTELRLMETGALYVTREKAVFDVLVESFGLPVDDPDLVFGEHFIPSPRNYGRYNNPSINELFQKQTRILDPVERKKVVDEMQRIVLTDVAKLIFGNPIYHYAHSARVKGWKATIQLHLAPRLQDVWLAK